MVLCTPKPNIWSLEALHILFLMFSNVELVSRLQWQGFGEVFVCGNLHPASKVSKRIDTTG